MTDRMRKMASGLDERLGHQGKGKDRVDEAVSERMSKILRYLGARYDWWME